MTDKKTVVHFGAGALGKGLVMPVLHDSGCTVAAVDADAAVVDSLHKESGYTVTFIGKEKAPLTRHIPVQNALLLGRDEEQIIRQIAEANTVTTSVRRENLGVVAKLVYEAWKDTQDAKTVLCCENVEHVSLAFSSLLAACAPAGKPLPHICVPDTIVDRGCGYDPQNRMIVVAEEYYEIGVDAKALADTGIRLIHATDDIERDFLRKRLLINTRADVTSYFAMHWGLAGFGDAIRNEKLQQFLAPYFDLLRVALAAEYNMPREEYDKWMTFYQARFSGSDNKSRPMQEIARSIWAKLSYTERIVYPLLLCHRHKENIDAGLDLVASIIRYEIADGITKEEAEARCQAMWCIDEDGQYIYNGVFQRV